MRVRKELVAVQVGGSECCHTDRRQLGRQFLAVLDLIFEDHLG